MRKGSVECCRLPPFIVGQRAHTYLYEGGGAAALGGIQPQPMEQEADGSLDLVEVEGLIKPDDIHYARTRLLCLENTAHGRVLPLGYLGEAGEFARRRGLRLHLDGARIFNASVKMGKPVAEIGRVFDSVSICLSKGLGAPVGSVLVGDAQFVREARRWRKMVGGGMRQAGILAAAGIYALENHVDRLAEDHENARRLAEGLGEIGGIEVDLGSVETNMVFVEVSGDRGAGLGGYLEGRGILIEQRARTRLVTHLDVRGVMSARPCFVPLAPSRAGKPG